MTKLAVPFTEAIAVAREVIQRLEGTYDRMEVAGSLRRGAATLGDVELVCVPRLGEMRDLWNEIVPTNEVRVRLGFGIAEGWLRPADKPAAGDRYARVVHVASGLQVDCFMVAPPAQWGVVLAIRTGPAEYSQWLVSEAKRRGYHVAHAGLHVGGLGHAEPDQCACPVVATPEEQDVFRVLGLPFLVPSQRGIA